MTKFADYGKLPIDNETGSGADNTLPIDLNAMEALGNMIITDLTPVSQPLKRCSACKQLFPQTLEYFHKSGPRLSSRCKSCISEVSRSYRERNAETLKEKKREYFQRNRERIRIKKLNQRHENPDKDRERTRKYRAEHPDQIREMKRRQYQKHVEEMREYHRRYRREHKSGIREISRRYRLRHQQEARERIRVYRSNNPEVEKARMHRRLARKRNLPNTFTRSDWKHAVNYFGGCCAVCNRPVGLWHTLAADHWIPLSSPDCPGTIPTNIVPLCHGVDGCNNAKNDKPAAEWLTDTFGARKAKKILARIQTYFDSLMEADHD